MKGRDLELPAGFRFHPTDEELVMHYLCRKCASMSIAVPIIAEIDIYKYDPWQLPGMALYGEKEWYFFSPRDRKYPNGSRPNRTAGFGYWKATGADKPIGNPKPVGIKKALVFYAGKAPKGVKTNWIMHEYRLANVDRSARRKNSSSSKLDDWVLYRIYNKKGDTRKQFDVEIQDSKPEFLTHDRTMMPPPTVASSAMNEFLYFNPSDSIPRLHTDSSCSEHVVSSEFTCEREVQSQPKWLDWERALNIETNNDIAIENISFPQFDNQQLSPLGDMFMQLQKPF